MTIEEVLAMDEKQIFDRKSIRIKPVDLSDTICAFANADGGTIAIGISDKRRMIEGVDYHTELLNDILCTPTDFCNPTVPVSTELVECINSEGKPDHVLLMHIEASPLLHVNQADEAYIRVGDKSKRLDFNDRMNLMYSKGVRWYEDEPVADAGIDDLDMEFVRDYCKRIGYSKTPEELITMSASIEWLDAMMEYYGAYGNDDDYKEICHLAGILFDNEGKLNTEMISVAKYAESLYVSLEDTSSIEEGDEGSLEQAYGTITGDVDGVDTEREVIEEDIEGVLLSNIKLKLIRDLETNGILPEGSYDRALKAVKDGFAGSGYSFYAYATSGTMDCGDYVYSGRNTGAFDITHNIKTMRNLAEVGELDNASYSQFKEMVMNSGRIYTEYVILTGNYTGRRECHIAPDWLLIYQIIETNLILILTRTGSHSDLF